MPLTTLEKSYGGYSTHSVRNAEPKKRNVPKYVSDKADGFVEDKGMDESKAWAVAWSIYCKYKEPGSEHCQKNKDEYFKGRDKKAYSSEKEYRQAVRRAKYISGLLYKHVSKLLKESYKAMSNLDERVQDLVMWKWTTGNYPSSFDKGSMTPRHIGLIAHEMQPEMQPMEATMIEDHQANKMLFRIFHFIRTKWDFLVYRDLHDKFEPFCSYQIRMSILNPANRIKHGIPLSRIVLEIFD